MFGTVRIHLHDGFISSETHRIVDRKQIKVEKRKGKRGREMRQLFGELNRIVSKLGIPREEKRTNLNLFQSKTDLLKLKTMKVRSNELNILFWEFRIFTSSEWLNIIIVVGLEGKQKQYGCYCSLSSYQSTFHQFVIIIFWVIRYKRWEGNKR